MGNFVTVSVRVLRLRRRDTDIGCSGSSHLHCEHTILNLLKGFHTAFLLFLPAQYYHSFIFRWTVYIMATESTLRVFWSKFSRNRAARHAVWTAPNYTTNLQRQLAGRFGCNSLYFENKALILGITPFLFSQMKSEG